MKILLYLLLSANIAGAQYINLSKAVDTNLHISLTREGYVDTYFGFDFNKPKDANRPYFVSSARHTEFNINLAYLSLKFNSPRARATFTPGFGTYMNANYSMERSTLQNLLEANVGIKLLKDKDLWLDVGVMPSPYSTESAISFDQLMYSRSIGSENVPYYLTGGRLSFPLGKKVNLSLYLLNDWQVIQDENLPLAFGTQLEYKLSSHLSLYWNTYIGNETSVNNPTYEERYFSDFYANWNPIPRFTFTASLYGGIQNLLDSTEKNNGNWWQVNIQGRFQFLPQHSLAARLEYFDDPKEILVRTITGVDGFNVSSASICYTWTVIKQVLFRVEARQFLSSHYIYFDPHDHFSNNDFLLISSLTAKF